MNRTNAPTRAATSRGFTSYLRTHCRNVYTKNARSHAHVSRGDGWKVQKEESWRGDRRGEINVRKGIDWPNCESRGSQRAVKKTWSGKKKASLVDWLVIIAACCIAKTPHACSCTRWRVRHDGFMFCGCQTSRSKEVSDVTNKQQQQLSSKNKTAEQQNCQSALIVPVTF